MGEDLLLRSEADAPVLTLGAGEAAAWVKARDRPLPGLAAKLGASPGASAWLIGGPAPEEVAVALAEASSSGKEGAAMIVAVLARPEDLSTALRAREATGLRVWCVRGKGRAAAVGDGALREAFRVAGWMDSRTSAVSDAFSATLYRPPRA
jgi:hypothetical protein